MARITIEDCLGNVNNMYRLVLVATRRCRQLYKGADPLVKCKNRLAVTALREIASQKVTEEKKEQAPVEDPELAALTN